jgi:hypothetical protein
MARGFYKYQSYLFTTKDPVIDELRTIIQRELGNGKLTRKSLKVIEENGGPKVSTTGGWFFKNVKRPQSATIEATGRAMGYKRDWIKMK